MVMWTIVQNDVLFLNKANCQSQCVMLFIYFWNELYRSCFITLTGHECSMTNRPCQMVSYQKSQRLKKLQQASDTLSTNQNGVLVNFEHSCLKQNKFLTYWLKAAALKPPQFFQMPKHLTKAHTSVSQLATWGWLDQSFIKTLLKTFLLLMLHFKCFTCKPPTAVDLEATTGKCQVVFEQFSKHWVKMLHTRFWEWATIIVKSVERVAHMLLLQRPGTTLGHLPASHYYL